MWYVRFLSPISLNLLTVFYYSSFSFKCQNIRRFCFFGRRTSRWAWLLLKQDRKGTVVAQTYLHLGSKDSLLHILHFFLTFRNDIFV